MNNILPYDSEFQWVPLWELKLIYTPQWKEYFGDHRLFRQCERVRKRAKDRNLPHELKPLHARLAVVHFNAHCPICKKYLPVDEITLDHWIPLADDIKGSTISNIIPMCGNCNNRKGCKHPRKFCIEELGLIRGMWRYCNIEAYLINWRLLELRRVADPVITRLSNQYPIAVLIQLMAIVGVIKMLITTIKETGWGSEL